ncbi:hypothetical protein J1614_007738 [Plenodomus biglobosus]|nr:hypothetical protein J1614_007738 [Plenodomus biglobosus]
MQVRQTASDERLCKDASLTIIAMRQFINNDSDRIQKTTITLSIELLKEMYTFNLNLMLERERRPPESCV